MHLTWPDAADILRFTLRVEGIRLLLTLHIGLAIFSCSCRDHIDVSHFDRQRRIQARHRLIPHRLPSASGMQQNKCSSNFTELEILGCSAADHIHHSGWEVCAGRATSRLRGHIHRSLCRGGVPAGVHPHGYYP